MPSVATKGLKGTLEKCKPFMQNDEHVTWKPDSGPAKGKTFFKFWLTVDGVEGSALSTKNEPSWKTGTLITYTKEVSEEGRVSFKDIKEFSEKNEQQGEKKDYYNDPLSIAKIAFVKGQDACVLLFEKLSEMALQSSIAPKDTEQIIGIGHVFMMWILQGQEAKPSKELMYNREMILKVAIRTLKFETMKKESKVEPWKASTEVIDRANMMLRYADKITTANTQSEAGGK